MKPSQVLKLYCTLSFMLGALFTYFTAGFVKGGELDANAAAVITLCWNVFFLMILPLILDWSERTYFHARFVALEELAATNPELKAILDEQCQKLSLPGLRLAAVDMPLTEPFTYGLWRQNPRLFVPTSWLSGVEKSKVLPSIEGELSRFARQDLTVVFLLFAIVQMILQYVILAVT